MTRCLHASFAVATRVNRLTENEGDTAATGFTLDIQVQCSDCGERFVFMGMPRGVLPVQPTMSADRGEARLPIAPEAEFAILTGPTKGLA